MSSEYEYDDQVYEDKYYNGDSEGEELEDEDEKLEIDDDEGDFDTWDDEEKKVHLSFVCEDCDYRWDETVIKRKDAFEDEESEEPPCPMCGSISVSQL